MTDPTGRAPIMVVLSQSRPPTTGLSGASAAASSRGTLEHEAASRVCAALRAAQTELIFHDLYAEGFDPVLVAGEQFDADDVVARSDEDVVDPLVARHAAELAEARALVVVHPDWWGKPPAIMTGWLDRVLMPALTRGRLPRLRRLLVINTVAPERTMAASPGRTRSVPPGRTAGMNAGQMRGSDPLGLIWRESVGRHLSGGQLERLVLQSDPPDPEAALAAIARATGWVAGGSR